MNPSIRLAEIDARRAAIQAEVAEIDALETPSDDDAVRAESLATEFAALDTERVDVASRAAALEAVRTAHIEAPAARVESGFSPPNVVVRRDPFEDVARVGYLPREEQVSRALYALEQTAGRRTPEAHAEEVARKIEMIPGVAAHVLATGSDAYRSAFDEYLRSQGRPNFTSDEAAAVRASLSLTGANGGYTLPFLLDPTLIHTGTATKNPIRRIARVETGTQNVWHGVSVGNVTTYWVAENTALTDGSPTFAQPVVTASKLTAYVTASYEVFEDSSLQAQLPGLIAESMDYAEGTTFITGSGSGAPKGIVTALSGTAAVTITATTRGQFNSASAVDVFALVNAIPSRYEDNATWVANKATFNTIKQMSTASNGSYFWSDFNAAIGNPLLGSPIVQASDMATAQTSGTKLIVLGDFSQYLIYDRIGVSVEFVQNVVDGSGLPTGTRGLIAHKRVGADVTDQNAFRIFNT